VDVELSPLVHGRLGVQAPGRHLVVGPKVALPSSLRQAGEKVNIKVA
jgi:hypothetical protein